MKVPTDRRNVPLRLAGLAAIAALAAGCSEASPPSPPPAAPAAAPAAASSPSPAPAPVANTPAAPKAAPDAAAKPNDHATTPAAAATGGSSLTVSGIRFPLPEGFRQVPPANQMRLAEVEVADPSGDPAKVSTIAFSTAGGTLQANLDRWTAQVLDPSGKPAKATITHRESGGLPWSGIESTGTFMGMGQGPGKPDWMLRGAVIELPQGLLFVKMTGPAASMTARAEAFEAMMTGMSLR